MNIATAILASAGRLAEIPGEDMSGDQSALRGVVSLEYRTTGRIVAVDLLGGGQCRFKPRQSVSGSS